MHTLVYPKRTCPAQHSPKRCQTCKRLLLVDMLVDLHRHGYLCAHDVALIIVAAVAALFVRRKVTGVDMLSQMLHHQISRITPGDFLPE